MADWSYPGGGFKLLTSPGGVSYHAAITSGAANTNGNWTEIIASLPYDSVINFQKNVHGYNDDYLFDVGVGAAGSEILAVQALIVPVGYTSGLTGVPCDIPMIFPAGSRISIRCQCRGATKVLYIAAVATYIGGFAKNRFYNLSNSYGYVTADSGGTSIDPGVDVNTYGAWTQIAAATERECKALIIGTGGQSLANRNSAIWSLDVGIGAVGFEVPIVIAQPIIHISGSVDDVQPIFTPIYELSIPAGTRLSVRTLCSINTATHRLFDVILYTFC